MIVCLRVDERLIHGQVAMTWTKELKQVMRLHQMRFRK